MRKRSDFTLPGLPDHKAYWSEQRHFLYAVELMDGTVKIGVTWNPAARVCSFCRKAKVRPVRAVAARIHEGLSRSKCERWALGRAAQIGAEHSGRERFTGLRFGEAANLIRQASRAGKA